MFMNIRSRPSRIAFAGVCTAALTLSALVAAAPAEAAATPASSCSYSPGVNSNTHGNFTGQGINIRTGPYTSCTAIGEGYESNSVTLRCAYVNTNGVLWFYLTDHSTGKTGWSSSQYIEYVGGVEDC